MDIVSHAIAGAAVGAHYGRPLEGAVCAILPDLVLPFRRVNTPPLAYNFTHSLLFLLFAWFITFPNPVPVLAIASHLLLDLPTHGKLWAPPLMFPVSLHRFSLLGKEWEWGSPVWFFGLTLTFIWSMLWFLVSK